MCLIIYKPQGHKVPKDVLHGALERNKDGYGIMYSDNGRLIIEKSLNSVWLTNRIEELEARELVIHLRMRTHGRIDLANCHPFTVTDKIGLVHNGMLDNYGDFIGDVSDTNEFVSTVLKPILSESPSLYGNDGLTTLIANHIDTDNKMVLMNAQGEVWFINRDQGLEYNGVWLSNTYAWKVTKSDKKKSKAKDKVADTDTCKINYKNVFKTVADRLKAVDNEHPDWDYYDDRDLPSHAPNTSDLSAEDLFYLTYDDLVDLMLHSPESIADAIVLRSENIYIQ